MTVSITNIPMTAIIAPDILLITTSVRNFILRLKILTRDDNRYHHPIAPIAIPVNTSIFVDMRVFVSKMDAPAKTAIKIKIATGLEIVKIKKVRKSPSNPFLVTVFFECLRAVRGFVK